MKNLKIFYFFYVFIIATFVIPFAFSGTFFWPTVLSNHRNFFFVLIAGMALFSFSSSIRSHIGRYLDFNLESKLEFKIIAGISIFYLLSYIKMVLLNYYSFAVDGIDFAVVDHMLPFTAAGKFMYHTVLGYNHFAIHVTPFLLLLYPIHKFFSDPHFFLLLHPFVLWSAVIPLYFLMKKMNISSTYKIIILFLFFNYNPVIRVLRYNFHFEVFYIPLFLWVFYFFEIRKWWALLFTAIIINTIKEDASLYLLSTSLALTVLLIMRKTIGKSNLKGIWFLMAAAAVSAAFFYLNFSIIIPASRDPSIQTIVMTSIISKYGTTQIGIILGMLTHPLDVLVDVFKSGALKELMCFLFLPLLTPFHLIATFPQVAITATSNYFDIRMLLIHYSSAYIPFVFYSFLLFLNGDSFLPSNITNKQTYANSLKIAMVLIFILGNSIGSGYIRYNQINSGYGDFTKIKKLINIDEEFSCIQGPLVPHFKYNYKNGNIKNIAIFTKECLDRNMNVNMNGNMSVKNYLFNTTLGNYPYSKNETLEFIKILDDNKNYIRFDVGEFVLFQDKEIRKWK
ncbi:MAG: DUF2079 domain-containing protein [Oligoflexia bacterium]|nr:DUF2079 domain-containing protein [Oligoflexia bacterium]